VIVLDTDHLTAFAFPESAHYQSLSAKIRTSAEVFGTTIVCLEEQLRGWLAAIKRKHDFSEQVPVYHRLGQLWDFFSAWRTLPFDNRAADLCGKLRKQKRRIGSQDLKIGAIAVTCDALLLSGNLRDFRHVPGLRVENWLE
jgi:tRNA(fMet)-specific endonuclease VapC